MLSFFRKSGPYDYIVCFLGNPGPRYAATRHNIGFMTADACEKAEGCAITKQRFKSLTGECSVDGKKLLLMKPQTLMNLSGEAVSQAAKFYKLPPERIIVVSDDVSLPVGKLRVRGKGSAGGHNGLKNIIALIGSDAFPRVKVGVGQKPSPDYDMADWVLGTFKNEDAVIIAEAVKRAWDAVKCIITDGVDTAQNRFN